VSALYTGTIVTDANLPDHIIYGNKAAILLVIKKTYAYCTYEARLTKYSHQNDMNCICRENNLIISFYTWMEDRSAANFVSASFGATATNADFPPAANFS
jgi:hypothetical protein